MSDQKSPSTNYESKESAYFESDRNDMLKYIPEDSSLLLEIGCGYGNFGRLLKRKTAAEIWGVEIDVNAAELAEKHFDRLFCTTFDRNLTLPLKRFDCIIFNDVLEHLVDPFDTLLYCKDLLCDSGLVIASVPNVRYFDNIWHLIVQKNWRYTDSGILDRTHLRFFTRLSLLETFESLGFDVKVLEGINPLEEVHPHWVKKFRLLNWISHNRIEDMRYLQFAIVACPKLN